MFTLPASIRQGLDQQSAADLAVPGMLPAPDFLHRRRQAMALARAAHGQQVEALIINDMLDIHYLTGTRHGISWLVLLDGTSFAMSRHMLVDEVRSEAVDCEILLASARSIDRVDLEQFIMGELTKRGVAMVVIDPAKLSAVTYQRLTARAVAAGIEVRETPEMLAGQRSVKDATELALTRHCVRIAEVAFSELFQQGAGSIIGRTERDLADELESRMWSLGADRQGFPETGIIVASGPNSAKPHHTPGQRRIVAGEALLIDWGAEVAGYRSDSTRTVFPGSVPEFAQRAYPIVEQALLRAAAQLRDGVAMGDIDGAARDTIIAAGYPEFHYGVGHGVGLAIHETPWLRANATECCATNMLTTIEPGIYLPGIGGIRIENIYLVTSGGHECLGVLPTDLAAMVIA